VLDGCIYRACSSCKRGRNSEGVTHANRIDRIREVREMYEVRGMHEVRDIGMIDWHKRG